MTNLSGVPSSSTMLRWTTLIVIAANMAFVVVFNSLSESKTLAKLAEEYGDTFLPAGFAKGICALIAIGFLLFYVAALWPSKRSRRSYDNLVIPLALTSMLATIWIVAFRHEEIALSVASIAGILALAGVMFARVAAISPGKYSRWLRVPFGVHFAAMTIALLVAVVQWLNASGVLEGTAVGPDVVAAVFLALAAAAGGLVAFRYRDFVYPAVIASTAGAMVVDQHVIRPDIATYALVAGVAMFVVVALAIAAQARQPRRDPKVRSTRGGAKVAPSALDESWYPIEGSATMIRL
jgi:benzodiazapine receptor